MKQFLPPFSLEESEKCNLLTNENSKYLLYKFNNWIESLNAEKNKISHSPKVKQDNDLIKIEEKDNQFLIEEIIGAVEKTKPYEISMEKNLKLHLKLKKTIGYVDASTNPCSLAMQTFLYTSA